jgi:hypothetical protein
MSVGENHVITFVSDKSFGLVDVGHRLLEEVSSRQACDKNRAPNRANSFGSHKMDANSQKAYTPRNPPSNPHTRTETY